MPTKMNFEKMKTYVEKKKRITSRAIRDWREYVHKAEGPRKLGKFGKYNARWYPI